MLTGSLAVLDVAAKYRERFLYGIYQVGARQIEKGTREAPVAYVDPGRAARPAGGGALRRDADEAAASRCTARDAPFTADGATYRAGSWIVRARWRSRSGRSRRTCSRRSAIRTCARARAGRPCRRTTRRLDAGVPDGRARRFAVATPFDVPLTQARGVPGRSRAAFARAPTGTSRIDTAHARPASYASARRLHRWIRRDEQCRSAVVNALLAAGVPGRARERASGRQRAGMEQGAFVVHGQASAGRSGSRGESARAAGRHRRARHASAARRSVPPLRAARIGLYKSWVANIDEGWTRWVLEQYRLPVHDAHERATSGRAASRERFDVVILPSQSSRAISTATGRARGRRRAGRGTPCRRSTRAGLATPGWRRCRRSCRTAGTLVALRRASDLVLERFGGVFSAHPRRRSRALDGRVLLPRVGAADRRWTRMRRPPSAWRQRPRPFFAGSRAFETDDPTVVEHRALCACVASC